MKTGRAFDADRRLVSPVWPVAVRGGQVAQARSKHAKSGRVCSVLCSIGTKMVQIFGVNSAAAFQLVALPVLPGGGETKQGKPKGRESRGKLSVESSCHGGENGCPFNPAYIKPDVSHASSEWMCGMWPLTVFMIIHQLVFLFLFPAGERLGRHILAEIIDADGSQNGDSTSFKVCRENCSKSIII